MASAQLEREATRLINKSNVRAARRLLWKVIEGYSFWCDDPITKACGEDIASEYRPPRWFEPELRRLGMTLEEFELELSDIAQVEGKFTNDPPHAYHEMAFVCVQLR